MIKVLIAVPCRPESARYIDFFRSLTAINLGPEDKIELFPGFFPEYGINQGVDKALRDGYSHIFIIDDDMIIPPHTLSQLLAYNKDIIGCNLLFRVPPFNPYIYTNANESGQALPDTFRDRKGLIKVDGISTGGLLIKVEVLKALKKPVFDTDDILKTYDFYFSREARKAGFEIYCDLDTVCGHIVTGVVWPKRVKGVWQTSVVISQSIELPLPPASRNAKGELVMDGVKVDQEILDKVKELGLGNG